MHYYCASRIASLLSGAALALCAAASQADEAAGDAPTGSTLRMEHDATVQMIGERDYLSAPLGGNVAKYNAAELRLNLQLHCDGGLCDGSRAVLKPRIWLDDESKPDALPSRQPQSLMEGYAIVPLGEGEVGAGKRLLGWGPSMLYSPTNRLFPDNGAVTPRREIAGKPMAFASLPFSTRGRFSLLLADPNLDPVPGIRTGGAFALARSEWSWVSEQSATLGVVLGGGGGLQPYAGSYAQYGLGDAWTLSGEFAASRGFARRGAAGPLLAQDQDRWRWDGTLGLRYGLASSAEIGLELIYNGYALTPAELANPLIAGAPSSGSSPSHNRPLHPFVQSRYALLQTTWPKLFGDRRWGLTTRWLQGLDQSSSDIFCELSYSPSDASTIYFGVSHSRVPSDLEPSRPVPRNVYLALEFHF
ncbi:hypothetical protein [Chromobacterium sphagni]|uniref:Alginate export domain-containing protein n=1 Tax=Chromobacterium sphagni TaxID=1903179 RepID=A0ABX3CIL3_9NEIS|nr:hypothetical protein [Chromobacterium sphagni]OHX21882.1 hypothetical protein BI344_05100 [Chromobacterium sphagni]